VKISIFHRIAYQASQFFNGLLARTHRQVSGQSTSSRLVRRFFNVGFVIDPDGVAILQHHKISALLPCERSGPPRDIFD
jgi:hypothetical protein